MEEFKILPTKLLANEALVDSQVPVGETMVKRYFWSICLMAHLPAKLSQLRFYFHGIMWTKLIGPY
jgi:hypothetical protein